MQQDTETALADPPTRPQRRYPSVRAEPLIDNDDNDERDDIDARDETAGAEIEDRQPEPVEPLITRHRPKSFAEVVGHDRQIGALCRKLKFLDGPRAYLFTGPSGVGKTTIARIVARDIGAEVLEVDAASNSGVAEMRQLIEVGEYRPLSGAARKMIIIDEAHGLSRQAMDALLKKLEEPPEHLYFALCTTADWRLRETIVSRCYKVKLRPLPGETIRKLIDDICERESWSVIEEVSQLIVAQALGSARQALNYLDQCHDAASVDEAQELIGRAARAAAVGAATLTTGDAGGIDDFYKNIEADDADEMRADARFVRGDDERERVFDLQRKKGERLKKWKDKLGHGRFTNWLRVERIDQDEAEGAIAIAARLPANSEPLRNLGVVALRALARRSATDAERRAIIDELERGTVMTAKEIKRRCSASRDAQRAEKAGQRLKDFEEQLRPLLEEVGDAIARRIIDLFGTAVSSRYRERMEAIRMEIFS